MAIQLPETAILAEVVGRAERWMKEASAALETSPDLKKLQALHSEASHMQVDLTETSALLWQKVEQAQKWVEKVQSKKVEVLCVYSFTVHLTILFVSLGSEGLASEEQNSPWSWGKYDILVTS